LIKSKRTQRGKEKDFKNQTREVIFGKRQEKKIKGKRRRTRV
jgi:hypothetical protein